METIRAYTTIEQSKKLAEILPQESADMYYEPSPGFCTEPSEVKFGDIKYAHPRSVRCWSLAALLKLIPESIYENTDDFVQLEITKRSVGYHDINDNIVIGTLADNLVDACVEMIIKLHDLNLL